MSVQVVTSRYGRLARVALLAGWFLMAAAQAAEGEPFIDLYGGWSKAQNTDVSASQRQCFVVGCSQSQQTTQSLAFHSGPSVGLRGGLWFNRFPWLGMAGDLSYFRSASRPVTLDSLALAATPMVRLLLFATHDRPRGLLQPYVGAGPTLAFHSVSADFQPVSPVMLSGWSLAVGWTARAGLAVPITGHIALFGEWRLTQDRVGLRENGYFGAGNQGRLDMAHTAQHYLFGLSYRF